MELECIIYNVNIVTEKETLWGYIGIKDEKIVMIENGNPTVKAKQMINAEGKYLLPGAIDTHPHFFDPGAEWREDYKHGTRAAASGGYTTILDMPNTTPPVMDEETFCLKLQRAQENSLIDYAFWASAMPDNMEQFERLKELGCIGFKAFTVDAGPDFRWSDEYEQYQEMKAVQKLGSILGAHAENPTLIKHYTDENSNKEWSLKVHDASRPWIAEVTAINTLLLFAKQTGCKVHICHLSTPEGAQLIADARKEGIDVSVETCSHYLTLNYEDNEAAGTFAMINPPLRNRDRMNKLWNYVIEGTIDCLGTDHAPYLEKEKIPEDGNMRKAMCGAPEIDVAIPLLLEEGVKKRKMSLQRFAEFTSTNAAKRFGLYPAKGVIRVGSDADFYIADMDEEWIYSRKNSFSKSKVSKFPHEGEKIGCKICATYLRGTAIYENGEIKEKPGYGKHIVKSIKK